MSVRLNRQLRSKIASGKKLLSVFVTAGYPRLQDSETIIDALEEAGVDFIELGIPFSDPIADGPVIQKASDTAIRNGVHLSWIFDLIKKVRSRSQLPILLMGYLNPVNRFGIESFINHASGCGADGLIIPDWPLEESAQYERQLKANDLHLIHLAAPNTSPERIKKIIRLSRSFIYCVAYTGVTGQATGKRNPLRFVKVLREKTKRPLMVGFGVKSRQDYRRYTEMADGVIIGSAFLDRIGRASSADIREETMAFVESIRAVPERL